MSYGNRIVLDDVSLEIEAGKRTFITGNNGAGKSTLIKALMDRAPETFIASEARVAYFSQDLDTLDPEKPCWKMWRRMQPIPSISAGPSWPTSI